MKNDTTSSPPSKAKAPLNLGGRLWKILMGVILIGVGWIFVQYLWHAYLRAAEMDPWIEVPCQIVTMEVDDSEQNQRGMTKYVFQVTYDYQFDGAPHTGNRFRRLPVTASDPRKLRRHTEDYAVGTRTLCHVDPAAPEIAVIKKDSKAALYTIWFPCLFIVGGAGMIFSALFRRSV